MARFRLVFKHRDQIKETHAMFEFEESHQANNVTIAPEPPGILKDKARTVFDESFHVLKRIGVGIHLLDTFEFQLLFR